MEKNDANFYLFKVTPVTAPRQVRSDVWKPRPGVVRYRAYRDEVILQKNKMKFEMPDAGSSVIFFLPMPKSWSKKKKEAMLHQPHQQTPDVDNLLKAFLDSVCKGGDEHVYSVKVSKLWAREGEILVDVEEDLLKNDINYLNLN